MNICIINFDNLEEWKAVKDLAFKILAIPASSAPVVRVFSQAGLATSRHRCNTKPDLLNDQLITYINTYIHGGLFD
jgi:hypothetical protein